MQRPLPVPWQKDPRSRSKNFSVVLQATAVLHSNNRKSLTFICSPLLEGFESVPATTPPLPETATAWLSKVLIKPVPVKSKELFCASFGPALWSKSENLVPYVIDHFMENFEVEVHEQDHHWTDWADGVPKKIAAQKKKEDLDFKVQEHTNFFKSLEKSFKTLKYLTVIKGALAAACNKRMNPRNAHSDTFWKLNCTTARPLLSVFPKTQAPE